MISKKYAQTLFMIFMSFGMRVIMSGVVVAVNTTHNYTHAKGHKNHK
jgi:hypothetical protein